jgi:hypothetical protein
MIFSVDGSKTTTCRIDKTIVGDYIVSTVFVSKEKSIPFYETIIFNTSSVTDESDPYNDKKTFCATKQEAEIMHQLAVELLKNK